MPNLLVRLQVADNHDWKTVHNSFEEILTIYFHVILIFTQAFSPIRIHQDLGPVNDQGLKTLRTAEEINAKLSCNGNALEPGIIGLSSPEDEVENTKAEDEVENTKAEDEVENTRQRMRLRIPRQKDEVENTKGIYRKRMLGHMPNN
ncbi:hypothetical protein E4U55_004364 [Claviceps digitariae]|nr:hypothetical protein E4U55_004364 [Claviceps digitariae]